MLFSSKNEIFSSFLSIVGLFARLSIKLLFLRYTCLASNANGDPPLYWGRILSDSLSSNFAPLLPNLSFPNGLS